MIEQAFIRVFNMSLIAGIMVLAVIFLRLCLRRWPKIFSYCLWAVVLFRLLCPFSFESEISLLGLLCSSRMLLLLGESGLSWIWPLGTVAVYSAAVVCLAERRHQKGL